MLKVFYHGDPDGKCAGAIVRRSEFAKGKDADYYEANYGNEEALVAAVDSGDEVVIVDFSFSPEAMAKILAKTEDVIWLDHHETAMDYDYGVELEGARDMEDAGCELAWKHFFPGKDMPDAVALIGDRDKWALKLPDSQTFVIGLQLYEHDPDADLWDDFLDAPNRGRTVESIIEEGKICERYRDNICVPHVDSFGFEAKLDAHNCLVLNSKLITGSEVFGDKFEQYDICAAFASDGESYKFSIYSDKPGEKGIHCGRIAEKFGGGGHAGAAGFSVPVADGLPFEEIQENDEENKSSIEGSRELYERSWRRRK